MATDLHHLHHWVSQLAEQQPFVVHWQIHDITDSQTSGPRPTEVVFGEAESGVIGQGAQTQLASFSTRKVSLLLACLALVHRGELRLDQRLAVTEAMKDGVQAGIMKNMAPGVQLSLEDHLRQMMITSDNICTQLVFEAIGQATGDSLQWVNDYCVWVGMRGTLHREIFPRSGDLDWHHSIEHMTVTTPADQAHLLARLGRGTYDAEAAATLHLSPALCRFAIELMHGIFTPLLGADTSSLRFAEKNGRGLRSLSQIGLATAEGAPVAAVAVFAEHIPTQLPDGTPGRIAAYELFAAVGQAVEAWHLGQKSEPKVASREPARFADISSARAVVSGSTGRQWGEGSAQRHPLAGVGKLVAAVALAERAERDPTLLQAPVTITARHREQAGVGPLRTHTGDLTLGLGDALGLIISASDAAASRAVRDALQTNGVDVVDAAQQLTDRLGHGANPLTDTVITGAESAEGAAGDLLVGETSPDDLVRLLAQLARAGGLDHGPAPQQELSSISAGAAVRVLGWMAHVFEPAGLTYALPGYGPKKVPQWSVAGPAPRSPSSSVGWSSVMITRAPVRAGKTGAGQTGEIICAAAHRPPSADGGRGAAGSFGALGLAAYRGTG